MPGGRPTSYTPELLQRAEEYLEQYANLGDAIPSIAGLACHIGVTRETCHAWDREEGKEEFSHILKRLLQKQEKTLLTNGLGGVFNSTITKLVLSKHGYSDKIEQAHTSPDGSMTPTVVERVIVRSGDASGD